MGPMTLQRALELSRNLVTVRVAQQIGMKRVADVAKEFGVVDNMGLYLPMALGAGDTTLLRMTMAYAMLANGALEITPSLVDRVQDRNGKTVYRHEPRACQGCGEQAAKQPAPPDIVDPRKPFHDPATVYQIVHMLQGVTTRGTAAQLAVLGRPIAGKTGTTNDARDNWFMGSTPDITIGIFVGFDEPRTLGPGNMETGGGNAAPIYERIARRGLQGQAADAVPHPARPAPGQVVLRGRHDRRGLQARHRARLRLQWPDGRRLDGRRFGTDPAGARPAAGRQRQASGPFRHGRDVLDSRRRRLRAISLRSALIARLERGRRTTASTFETPRLRAPRSRHRRERK